MERADRTSLDAAVAVPGVGRCASAAAGVGRVLTAAAAEVALDAAAAGAAAAVLAAAVVAAGQGAMAAASSADDSRCLAGSLAAAAAVVDVIAAAAAAAAERLDSPMAPLAPAVLVPVGMPRASPSLPTSVVSMAAAASETQLPWPAARTRSG